MRKYRNVERAFTSKSSGIERRDTRANLVLPPGTYPTDQISSKVVQLMRNAVVGCWPAPIGGKKPHSDKRTYWELAIDGRSSARSINELAFLNQLHFGVSPKCRVCTGLSQTRALHYTCIFSEMKCVGGFLIWRVNCTMCVIPLGRRK